MNKTLLMDMRVNKDAKQIEVTREFDAPRALVWQAWTDPEILDQWWAPKPWRAETKRMDFREGGEWLYCMVGPEGERHWSFAEFKKIKSETMFTARDGFCDENGTRNTALPGSHWENRFREEGDSTMVDIKISFEKLEGLEAIVKMGFKEGFTMGLENLDAWLSTNFMLRGQNKTEKKARVTTYLNFPGNTEEAFNFYKKVFNGKFVGKGLQRFRDVQLPAEHPPMSESDKDYIIHAELEILGGHILMATDAPQSMGFTLNTGNNMHINIEPSSRAETERIFKALAEGGKVSMPLQDMFFGAYFGELTDKYGINWMLSFQNPVKKSK